MAFKKPATPAAPPEVAVSVPQPANNEAMEWDEYPGRIEAVDSSKVHARVRGYLQSIHFKDGAEVRKGDLLFVIDPRPYQSEVDRVQAEVNQAKTHLELAANDLARADNHRRDLASRNG